VLEALLRDTAARSARYLAALDERPVTPTAAAVERIRALAAESLPEQGLPAERVLALLDEVGSPATVASAGGRFFGLVVGGSLPAALAANWLATAWDQNSTDPLLSPTAALLEETALAWLLELLGLPRTSGGAFVTGATMANFAGLAAARHGLLARLDWDVERHGLFGAPALDVIAGEEVHPSLVKALGMLGLGRERLTQVPVDAQGRMCASRLPALSPRSLLCVQAGNVNSGACDAPRSRRASRERTRGPSISTSG
jgi:aromatic-L-amino-acid decarboxylase